MLGTASGTFPGFKAGPTVVPLNLPDPYLTITATQANQGPFVSTIGVLDGNGAATAAILLPPGLPATLAGLELAHSFLVAEPGPAGLNDTVLATDAMPLRFDP